MKKDAEHAREFCDLVFVCDGPNGLAAAHYLPIPLRARARTSHASMAHRAVAQALEKLAYPFVSHNTQGA